MEALQENSDQTLESFKLEYKKQTTDLKKLESSLEVLKKEVKISKSKFIEEMILKFENVALDKKQIIVNIKVCILKLELAMKQAKKVEDEVATQYKKLFQMKNERKATEIEVLPADYIKISKEFNTLTENI